MILFHPESAELAAINTNIGVVDMTVMDEKGLVPMNSFAGDIGQIPDSQKVEAVPHPNPVIERQALSGTNLFLKRRQRFICKFELQLKTSINHYGGKRNYNRISRKEKL
jgi:hypothetical protein